MSSPANIAWCSRDTKTGNLNPTAGNFHLLAIEFIVRSS